MDGQEIKVVLCSKRYLEVGTKLAIMFPRKMRAD
jgi:hypothetical protein